jgi:hypothetical protein
MHCSYLIFVVICPIVIKQSAMIANSLSCLGLLIFSKSEVSSLCLRSVSFCYSVLVTSATMSDAEMRKDTCLAAKGYRGE